MIISAIISAILICALILLCISSNRFHDLKDKHQQMKKEFNSLQKHFNEKREELIFANETLSLTLASDSATDLLVQKELILKYAKNGIIYLDKNDNLVWTNIDKMSNSAPYKVFWSKFVSGDIKFGLNTPLNIEVLKIGRAVKKQFVYTNEGVAYDTFAAAIYAGAEYNGAIVTVEDITANYFAQKDLRAAKQLAEETLRSKAVLFNSINHEITQPLNAIIRLSKQLADTQDPEEMREYSDLIISNNNILIALYSDILNTSKIDNIIEMQPAKTDFAKLFTNLANSLKTWSKNPDVEFIIESPYKSAIADIDFKFVSHVITIMAINAIKYTESGSIRVGYSYCDDMMEVYVKDTGIGFSEDEKERIFNKFYKVNPLTNGNGLGLSILKSLAIKFGCTYGAESIPDEGSYFYVRGPIHMDVIDN